MVARTYDTITQTASNNLKPLLSAFRSFTEDTSTSRFFAEPRPTSERYCSALSSLPDFFNVAVLIPTDTSTISLRRSDASALIFELRYDSGAAKTAGAGLSSAFPSFSLPPPTF